jgi:uncharacterized protein
VDVPGSGPGSATVATIVVSHRVASDDEVEFLAWQERLTATARTFAGFLGAELIRPLPGVHASWTVLCRYDSAEHADAWLDSADRRRLLAQGRQFEDFELHRISAPFGSWFAQPAELETAAPPPAEWKTALSVLAGLYPTVVLLTLAIDELWKGAPLWASLLVGNIASVSLLTWVVMPVVTRALRFWLVPGRAGFTTRTDLAGTVLSIAFLTVAALIFWLGTTQLWHLP